MEDLELWDKYIVAAAYHGSDESEIYIFDSEDEALGWCYDVGYFDERYRHLLVTTHNGRELVAQIPT